MISSEGRESVRHSQEAGNSRTSVAEPVRCIGRPRASRIARASHGDSPGAGICFRLAPAYSKHGLARVVRATFSRDIASGDVRLSQFGDAPTYGFGTGKAALRFALEAMASLDPEKRQVVVPAYTCYSVPAAVEQAGLKMVLCDVDPATLDFDHNMLRRLVSGNTLCIVAAHLFGSPIDLEVPAGLARENGAFVLEDAAQGGERAADLDLCDVRLWSFSRGKPVSTFGGGMLACGNPRLDAVLSRRYQSVATARPIRTLKQWIGAIAADVGSHPRLFWLTRGVPFLRVGETIYPEGVAIVRDTRFQRSLLPLLGEQIERNKAHRKRVARYYYTAFSDADGSPLPSCTKDKGYAPPRFPLYLSRSISAMTSDQLAGASRFGVVRMYPSSIDKLPRVHSFCSNMHERFPGARTIADRLVTLPTHLWVGRQAQQQVVNAVRELQQQ